MILDFSFGGRTEKGNEIVLELASGADVRCVLHHVSSLTHLEGFLGPSLPGKRPKLVLVF